MIRKMEYIEVTCEECGKTLGFAINPTYIAKIICEPCVENQDDFQESYNGHDRKD